jgi:hypothetical protein
MSRYNYPGYKSTGEGWLGARAGTKGGYHGGTDNPADAETPVYAEHGGRVFRSGQINGYGMSVIVESTAPDGTRFYELYGHLGPGPLPDPGAEIKAGEPIPGAVIGTKKYVQSKGGITSGPHLHREIISGNVRLNPKDGLGIYSSKIEHKADPDTFDINHPVFPYENGEPLPTPVPPAGRRIIISPRGLASPTPLPDRPDGGSEATRQSEPSSQLRPGMAIPSAVGPTSIGGPDGPTPVVPPVPLRQQPPLRLNPRSETISPAQRLNPAVPQAFGPFGFADPLSPDVSTSLQGTYARSADMPSSSTDSARPWQNAELSPSSDALADASADHIWIGMGGLPGLLALVNGENLSNSFGRDPPEDPVAVRRLVSRPARY